MSSENSDHTVTVHVTAGGLPAVGWTVTARNGMTGPVKAEGVTDAQGEVVLGPPIPTNLFLYYRDANGNDLGGGGGRTDAKDIYSAWPA